VSSKRLAKLKDGATVVNTARGGLIDEHALIQELIAGRLNAGLDVFEQEPLALDSPLMSLENVVLVPHLGSATAATRQAMLERALVNLVSGLARLPLPYCVNPEVYKRG